jgi:hypothetical protein
VRALIAFLLLAGSALAGQQSIHVEWGYTPPSAPAVTGFQLYQEGVKSCLWPGATTTAGDCDVNLTKKATNYTLTATFDDGTESPHSAPFRFTLPEPAAPVLIKIEVGG